MGKIYTFDELLNMDIYNITEDEKNYYIKLELEEGETYDNSLWVVDKKTKAVSYMLATDYMVFIHDKTKPVDPLVLKRAS